MLVIFIMSFPYTLLSSCYFAHCWFWYISLISSKIGFTNVHNGGTMTSFWWLFTIPYIVKHNCGQPVIKTKEYMILYTKDHLAMEMLSYLQEILNDARIHPDIKRVYSFYTYISFCYTFLYLWWRLILETLPTLVSILPRGWKVASIRRPATRLWYRVIMIYTWYYDTLWTHNTIYIKTFLSHIWYSAFIIRLSGSSS